MSSIKIANFSFTGIYYFKKYSQIREISLKIKTEKLQNALMLFKVL
jgi:hypothetical protein